MIRFQKLSGVGMVVFAVLIFLMYIHSKEVPTLSVSIASNTTPDAVVSDLQHSNECGLPTYTDSWFAEAPDVTGWKLFKSASYGISFLFPPGWEVEDRANEIDVIPPYSSERNLPYQGDSGGQFGIEISTSTDPNGLDFPNEKEIANGLSELHFPLQTKWVKTPYHNALVAYCIYNYEAGISAMFPLRDKNVMNIAITRFAAGENRPEDWKTFFGILWSMR